MISVSDHETGGLALGRQLTSAYPEYAWHPEVLLNVTHSTAWSGSLMRRQPQPISRTFVVEQILRDSLNILDATDKEIDELVRTAAGGNVDYVLADMVSFFQFFFDVVSLCRAYARITSDLEGCSCDCFFSSFHFRFQEELK